MLEDSTTDTTAEQQAPSVPAESQREAAYERQQSLEAQLVMLPSMRQRSPTPPVS